MVPYVVIGSHFGDEGKGLITAYLARECGDKSLVVRYSGGANAGHTVIHDGRRHVFHHIGSGALTGAHTYLSEHFICNPLLFRKEFNELKLPIKIACHREARVTTPYDMLINQELEKSRGANRHGSCGVGIFETVKRSEHREYDLRFGDLVDSDRVRAILGYIRNSYVRRRLSELKLDPSDLFKQRLHSADLVDAFVETSFSFWAIARGEILPERYERIVFEGSQGILLDEKSEFFPYVTPARTGILNASKIARQWGFGQISAHYVTRPYVTRHGPGPFPGEDKNWAIKDDTNIANDWQGTLRVGTLDHYRMNCAIASDLKDSVIPAVANIALTHCDTVVDEVAFFENFEKRSFHPLSIMSFGPSTNHVSTKDERFFHNSSFRKYDNPV